jgi:hypothetical protein
LYRMPTLPHLQALDAVRLCGAIAAVGILYNSLEFLIGGRDLLERFYDWRIVRSRYYILIGRPVLGWLFDATLSGRQFVALTAVQAIAALLFPIAVGWSLGTGALLAFIVLAGQCVTHLRLLIGMDGSDQMQTVIWATLFLYCLPLTPTARIVVLGFIGAQLLLSYLVSGWAKASSPVWRSGVAVGLITRTATYCTPTLSGVFTRPRMSFIASWGTILFEVGAPFLLLFGRPGFAVFAMAGLLFHIGIAVVMGLTTFVFAFGAALPVVYHFANYL